MGTDMTLDAAAALQKEKTAARMRLIKRLHRATQSAAQLDELLTNAKRLRKAAPPDLFEPLDHVVEAATRAASAAGEARATAWQDATAGGWTARELRQIGITPVRRRREKTAVGDAPPPSGFGVHVTQVPTTGPGPG